MSDASKLIEQFLQKNGLLDTLKAFRQQSKRTSQKAPPSIANIHKLSIPSDEDASNKIREHLQKADPKYLKKFVDRVKRLPASNGQEGGLKEQRFFKRLVEKEREKYEQYKENALASMNAAQFLDESRFFQNEWQGENDMGFQVYEFPLADLPKVVREIQAMQTSKGHEHSPVKEVAFPQAYYANWHQIKDTRSYNAFDKMTTRLPPNVLFDNRSSSANDPYPLQSGGIVYESHDLKLIYDREKTGFEEEREMTIVINEVLAGRFQIISVLGQAQFSKAIQVRDLTSPNQKQRYCLKVVENNKEYMDQSMDEIKLLRYIKANCNPDDCALLLMHDYFYHRQHLMILTELLKDSLLEAYQNKPEYFTLPRLQAITKQIATALATLHRLHIIHCDLKPQNILIKSYSNCQVKVIDVGSSIFFHDHPQLYVQTRSYRAPEIILGCEYTQKIDMWSLGCILAELYTGKVLFESESEVGAAGLLALMQGLRGPWPSWMLEKGRDVQKYFTKEMVLFQEISEEVGPQVDGRRKRRKTGFCRVFTPKMTNLKARIKTNNKHFLDFLSKCLKLDPSARISAKEALMHPFLTEPIAE